MRINLLNPELANIFASAIEARGGIVEDMRMVQGNGNVVAVTYTDLFDDQAPEYRCYIVQHYRVTKDRPENLFVDMERMTAQATARLRSALAEAGGRVLDFHRETLRNSEGSQDGFRNIWTVTVWDQGIPDLIAAFAGMNVTVSREAPDPVD